MTHSEKISLYDPIGNTFVMELDTITEPVPQRMESTVRVNFNHGAMLYMTPDALRDWAKAITKAANRLDTAERDGELIYTGNPE